MHNYFSIFKNKFSNNKISNVNKENQYTAEKSSTSQNNEKITINLSGNNSNTSSQTFNNPHKILRKISTKS